MNTQNTLSGAVTRQNREGARRCQNRENTRQTGVQGRTRAYYATRATVRALAAILAAGAGVTTIYLMGIIVSMLSG